MQLVNKQTAGKAARYQTVAVKLANAGYRNGTEPTTTAKTKTFFHELNWTREWICKRKMNGLQFRLANFSGTSHDPCITCTCGSTMLPHLQMQEHAVISRSDSTVGALFNVVLWEAGMLSTHLWVFEIGEHHIAIWWWDTNIQLLKWRTS